MSLQFIIDGYNITNHAQFARIHKQPKDPAAELLAFIRLGKSTLSSKAGALIVFDGFPLSESGKNSAGVIFSRKISADEKIKRIVEGSADRKHLVVVSDDRELQDTVRYLGAKCMSVEEFIKSKRNPDALQDKDTIKQELSFTEIHKINQELRKLWLK